MSKIILKWWHSMDKNGFGWRQTKVLNFLLFHNVRSGVIRPWRKGDELWRDDSWFRMVSGWPYSKDYPYGGLEKAGSDKEIDGVFWTWINLIIKKVKKIIYSAKCEWKEGWYYYDFNITKENGIVIMGYNDWLR